MSIRLFDYLDRNTSQLLQSLEQANIGGTNLFIHYDGQSVAGNYWNPFLYYSGRKVENTAKKPLFFNEVTVPKYSEIRNRNQEYADILTGETCIGKINYFPDSFRKVKQVDWLDKSAQVIQSDFYSTHGEKYAYGVYDQTGHEAIRYFIDQSGKDRVVWNKKNKSIRVLGDQEQYFPDLTTFLQYFIKELQETKQIEHTKEMIINSLSTPLFVSDRGNFSTVLFWQETIKAQVPGNMQNQLVKERSVKQIIFEEEQQLQLVKNQFPDSHVNYTYLAPLYSFARDHQPVKKALIVTKSDQLVHLTDILTRVPSLAVTIAAPTKMSAKLKQVAVDYPQVTLYENITNETYEQLFATHDLYLNINQGTEVRKSLEKAYLNQMITLSFESTRKNSLFNGLLFTENTREQLINQLLLTQMNQLLEDKVLQQALTVKGPLSTVTDYQNVFGI